MQNNEIAQPRHPIDIDELPSNIKIIANQLLTFGKVLAQHSRTWHEGEVFKTGKRAGEKRPDKTADNYAIALPGKNPLTATWLDGKFLYAKGILDGKLFWTESVTELKRKIKEEWHESPMDVR